MGWVDDLERSDAGRRAANAKKERDVVAYRERRAAREKVGDAAARRLGPGIRRLLEDALVYVERRGYFPCEIEVENRRWTISRKKVSEPLLPGTSPDSLLCFSLVTPFYRVDMAPPDAGWELMLICITGSGNAKPDFLKVNLADDDATLAGIQRWLSEKLLEVSHDLEKQRPISEKVARDLAAKRREPLAMRGVFVVIGVLIVVWLLLR